MSEEEREPSPYSDEITEHDSSLLPQTNNQLAQAIEQAKLKRIERGEKIKAVDDWIGFITLKTVGIGGLIVGGLEIIAPAFLTVTLTPPLTPFTLVGVGLALITGKKSIALIKIVLNSLSTDDEENDP